METINTKVTGLSHNHEKIERKLSDSHDLFTDIHHDTQSILRQQASLADSANAEYEDIIDKVQCHGRDQTNALTTQNATITQIDVKTQDIRTQINTLVAMMRYFPFCI